MKKRCPELHVVELLESACDQESNLTNHNISTAIISLMIAKGRSWTSPHTLFIVSASALFHDIALMPLNEQLKKSTPEALSKEDFEKYQMHPVESAELLARYGKFPEAILSITAQRHEKSEGTGFPKQLRKSEIHPIAEIINLASQFSHFYLGGLVMVLECILDLRPVKSVNVFMEFSTSPTLKS